MPSKGTRVRRRPDWARHERGFRSWTHRWVEPLSTGLFSAPKLASAWHTFRIITASFTLVTGVVLGVIWTWSGGYLCALLAAAAVTDAVVRRTARSPSPMPSIFLDVTLIGVAMAVVQLEPVGVGAPFIYMLIVPALLLPWRRASVVMGYAVAWTAVTLFGPHLVPLSGADKMTITALAYFIFAGHTVALVVVVSQALEKSYRDQRAFLGAVSHEIRTPLTSILGWSALLDEGAVAGESDEGREATRVIRSEAEQVAAIVEDLLAAARLDMGGILIRRRRTDLYGETMALIASMPSSNEHEVKVEVEGSSCEAFADALRTRQILRNLLTNAVRHGRGRVWVRLAQTSTQAVVAVCDDGLGIPDGLRGRLFDPYTQADPAGPTQGMGLGLSVSRSLARLMEGDLQYRRSEGATVFELTLPTPAERTVVD